MAKRKTNNQVKFTKPVIVKKLLDYKEEFGSIPTMKDWQRNKNFPDPQTVINRFGSWNKALIEAGLEPNRIKADPSDVDKAVREVIKLGVTQEEAAKHFRCDQSAVSKKLTKLKESSQSNFVNSIVK